MHMNLFITTFNAQKKPPSTEFTDAVGLKLPADPADLYVFSFQELSSLLDSTYSNIIMDQLTGLAHTIQDMLSLKYSEASFSIDTIEQYGGLGIIIVSPSNSHISNMVSSKGYPVGHLYTTLKGGIGVRLKCNDQELTFVNVHLNAGEKKHHLVKRNKDIYDILSGLEFDDGWSVLKPMGHGFIMGDLNYRNTGAFQLGRCDFANSNELLKDDELTIMRNSNIVLQMYDEAHVGFEPSYKYVVGTDKYNKKRIPSYCDRILYVKGGNYTVFKYDAIKECRSSDHKPVYLYVGVGDPPRDIINNSGYLATNTGRVTVILRWNYKLRKILVHQISAITTYLLSCGLWLNSSRGRIFTLFFLILLMIFWKYIV